MLRELLVVAAMVIAVTTSTALTAQVVITPGTMPGGVSGTPYSQAFTASGGAAPYAFTNEAGRLPNVLTLTPGGLLSGTPQPATIPFEIWATDADGREAKVSAARTVIQYTLVATGSLPPAQVGQAYTAPITVSGGTAPFTCIVTSGALPPGVTLTSSCTLAGAPSKSTRVSAFRFDPAMVTKAPPCPSFDPETEEITGGPVGARVIAEGNM